MINRDLKFNSIKGKGVELSILHSEISKLTDGKFNYKHYGFSKFIKLLESIPHVVQLQTSTFSIFSHWSLDDGKLFKIFLAKPSLIEKRPLDYIDPYNEAVPKRQKQNDSVEHSKIIIPIETPKPLTSKSVGSFYISSGYTEFNLPITNDTSEIILLDLDNTASWAPQFLQYTLNKNDGKLTYFLLF